ncbi:MAG: hypothetical protein IJ685_03390 [Selenomonadaceae bacterium]|nr:hypothetical protein [Selenomonadaceae bacterium]
MKVYDCFTFYNEFELLELRLKALWSVVDYFIIVEANRTHTNKPKPFYFWERQDEFKEFFPKIRHLPVEMNVPYNGTGDWSIENAQRDAIIYGLEDAAPDDWIFISDLDEIPAPDIIQRLQANEELFFNFTVKPPLVKTQTTYPAKILVPASEYLEKSFVALGQNFHQYYFDRMSCEPWLGTVLTKRKNLTTPQMLRDARWTAPFILNGGRHFSYMGGTERVIEKMNSIVDGNEFVIKSGGELIDRRHVEESMLNGTDIYNRQDIPASQFFPFDAKKIKLPCLNEFLKKYPYFLREPEKYFTN